MNSLEQSKLKLSLNNLIFNRPVVIKIKLKSTLDSNRVFKLKIKEFVPNQKLVWGDAMGERTYTLQDNGGSTLFTMTEKIGGPLFPLFASKIPSFDESFEQFAADLKKKAEQ